MASGLIIICMAKEYTVGKTEGCMRASISMIKNMASVFTLGQMGDNIMECGKRASNMVKENTYCHLVSREEGNGKMEIESDGLMQLLI